MFMNDLKIAIRQLRRHKTFAFINVAGLAVGISACFLILIWVRDEVDTDRFHDHGQELYRVVTEFTRYNEFWPVLPIPVGPALQEEIPEVIETTRCSDSRILVHYAEQKLEATAAYVDPSFFRMFTFPAHTGDPSTALKDISSIVISQNMAHRLFGDQNALGQIIRIDNGRDVTVQAVLDPIHSNTHLEYDFFMPFQYVIDSDRDPTNWRRFQTMTYVQLQKGSRLDDVAEKVAPMISRRDSEAKIKLHLQSLSRIHLYDFQGGGRIKQIILFSILAGVILIAACINFINLATARAMTRLKEIGIRSVAGARRWDLFRQFMAESLVICGLSAFLSIGFINLALPLFNRLAGKAIQLNWQSTGPMLLLFLGITIVTGLVSGTMPSLQLSKPKLSRVFRGGSTSFLNKIKIGRFRNSLVVFQFSIAAFLVVGSLILNRQITFLNSVDTGYHRDNVIVLHLKGDMATKLDVIKQEILKQPDIEGITAVSELPTSVGRRYQGLNWETKNPDLDVHLGMFAVDFDFFKTMNVQIVEGRPFSKNLDLGGEMGYILNETAVRAMEIESPVGKWIEWSGRGRIIGVVKDFNFQPLTESIGPLFMVVAPERFNYLCVRTRQGPTVPTSVITYLENVWERFAPAYPFQYRYLNDYYGNLYRSENRTKDLLMAFTGLALFISMLGLLGLSIFYTQQRIREIGIRKILGATIPRLLGDQLTRFIGSVLIANAVAWPLAFFAGRQWLSSYAYRASIPVGLFLISGIFTIILTIITVLYQSYKAAQTNPVDTLKCE